MTGVYCENTRQRQFETALVGFIEIIELDSEEVVTVIELLSLANKYGEGREQYLDKQKQLLRTSANLVEIDLLGCGRNTVLARHVHEIKSDDWRYLISISRAANRTKLEYYAVSMNEPLPRCLIPLRPPDPDTVLDLQSVFTYAYDRARYHRQLNYQKPPNLSLDSKQLGWIEQQLVEKGIRNPT